MANQDKEQVPEKGGELETWDLNKTKVRIYVDRTKWQKRYPCRPRLMQRLRRPAFQAVEGCKPEWQGIENGTEKLLMRLQKKYGTLEMAKGQKRSLLGLRRGKGESASSWENKSYECYQRAQGANGPEVTTKKSKDRPWSWTTSWSTKGEETDTEDELINSSDDDLAARDASKGQQRDRSIFIKEDTTTQTDDEKVDEWPENEKSDAGGEEEPRDEMTEEEQAALTAAQEARAEALRVVQGAQKTLAEAGQ